MSLTFSDAISRTVVRQLINKISTDIERRAVPLRQWSVISMLHSVALFVLNQVRRQ